MDEILHQNGIARLLVKRFRSIYCKFDYKYFNDSSIYKTHGRLLQKNTITKCSYSNSLIYYLDLLLLEIDFQAHHLLMPMITFGSAI